MNFCLKISTSNFSDFTHINNLFTLFEVENIKTIILPRRKKRFVFIKSPHVNNSSKEHFQIVKFQRLYYVRFSIISLRKFLTKTPNTTSIKIISFC